MTTGKTVITSCFLDIVNGKIKISKKQDVYNEDTEEEAEKRFEKYFDTLGDNVVWSKYSWVSHKFEEGSGDIIYNALFLDLDPDGMYAK